MVIEIWIQEKSTTGDLEASLENMSVVGPLKIYEQLVNVHFQRRLQAGFPFFLDFKGILNTWRFHFGYLVRLRSVLETSQSVLGRLVGVLPYLGGSWRRFEASCRRLEAVLRVVEGVLKRLGAVLARSWGVLNASWGGLGASWGCLGRPKATVLAVSYTHLTLPTTPYV